MDGDGAAPRPVSKASSKRPGFLSRLLYRLLTRFHRWAESGWGGFAVGRWGILQGSVMPGPTDVVLVPLGIADPGRVFRLALWATAGATLGGLVAYGVGAFGGEHTVLPLLERFGVAHQTLARARVALEERGWLVVALSTISPLPSKVVCLAAGVFGVPVWQFLPALLVGRAARFLSIAALLRFAGPGVIDAVAHRAGVRPRTWETEPAAPQ
ncbi:MAG TPA: VTT domain-containing protein [Gemmatimonadaceae bacterium]|nr:VTT domain-containing protein [Gemmatimonadaceae bacterium]